MKLSLVVPCHNEEAAAPVFLEAVMPILHGTGLDFELIFVDDGSRDATVAVLLAHAERYPQIRVIELSRNFGKEAAMTAGFTYATGDAIIRPLRADQTHGGALVPTSSARQIKKNSESLHAGMQDVARTPLRRPACNTRYLPCHTGRPWHGLCP